MIEIGIIIEGSDGLTWPIWKRLARTVEDCGYKGLYRSDHLTSNSTPDKPSLELWVSLTWLASHSNQIEFGPLVTPSSFRNPIHTARMACAVDDLSNGRLLLGLGAGGWEREHQMFGFKFGDIPTRMKLFEESTEVVYRLLHNENPVTFNGKYYQLKDAIQLPRPQRSGGPPILIGGNGGRFTLPLAARFADEWNCVFLTPRLFQVLNTQLNELLIKEERAILDVKRSMVTGCIFGKDEHELKNKIKFQMPKGLSPEQKDAVVAGTGNQIVDQISQLGQVGIERIMLIWFDLNDNEGLEAMANAILPELHN